ncbi:hypothetical protein [Bacillus sp. B15-48]|uniref:hypothetical protein n=1 Tax=Bacillus sp. B15-48 TaxID=1548601 RepID=UPI00193F8C50|nr:hypothetical protein [Bacillus sp. B15-48]MBM4764715.1 hypothetical protein [Bacillus sp. B15-48]
MLVKDMYFDAIMYEESVLAHVIQHLILERKVSWEDPISLLDFDQADMQKVTEMINGNALGFKKINCYSLKMDQKKFIFIFAASPQEAVDYFTNSFQQRPLNCHEMLLDYEMTRGNEVKSFRALKNEHEKYPAIAGCFERD